MKECSKVTIFARMVCRGFLFEALGQVHNLLKNRVELVERACGLMKACKTNKDWNQYVDLEEE